MVEVSKFYIKYLLYKQRVEEPFSKEELDQFWCKNKTRYTACDNSTGECRLGIFDNMILVKDFFKNPSK
ncbi:MAG: hypothetical protein K2H02_02180 [Anaeroplasmataceae bacterium]|nr:hypothetical protein [Anaeroplasmataceae bacterium]MDE5867730.1 hypothetical protein [Anaeroplasmataceae bacterium]